MPHFESLGLRGPVVDVADHGASKQSILGVICSTDAVDNLNTMPTEAEDPLQQRNRLYAVLSINACSDSVTQEYPTLYRSYILGGP